MSISRIHLTRWAVTALAEKPEGKIITRAARTAPASARR